jgi:hypothetical protein
MAWIVEVLDTRVRDEFGILPADMRARFRRIVELIQNHGSAVGTRPPKRRLPPGLAAPRCDAGAWRVVRVFVKKTQKTPRREMDLALERAKEVSP